MVDKKDKINFPESIFDSKPSIFEENLNTLFLRKPYSKALERNNLVNLSHNINNIDAVSHKICLWP